MIVSVVRSVFRSMLLTLGTTLGDTAMIDMDVGEDAPRNASDGNQLVALISPPVGPLRALVVCCDEVIAHRIGSRLHLPSTAADVTSRVRSGFRVACSVLQQNLARETDWYVPTPHVLYFGQGRLHDRTVRDRFFRIVAHANDGKLELLASFGVSERLVTAPPPEGPIGLVAEEKSKHGAVTGPGVDEVFASVGHTDVDVQIEVPVSRWHTEVHFAKIVSRTVIKGHPVLGIFAPALKESAEYLSRGTEILVFLSYKSRLCQFRTKVVGMASLKLEADSHLRLLAVHAPKSIVAGQRRRAYRVRPSQAVAVNVERCIVDNDRQSYETGSAVATTLYDISLSGIRVRSQDISLARTFALGTLVLCNFQLPDGEPSAVPGIVRRTTTTPTPEGDRYELGIEFLNNPSWRMFANALDGVARFIGSEQVRAKGTSPHPRA